MQSMKNLKKANGLLTFAVSVALAWIPYAKCFTQPVPIDSLYCIPMWQAERVFEDAYVKLWLDTMVTNREVKVLKLETLVRDVTDHYEGLLMKEALKNKELAGIILETGRQVGSYELQLKQERKKKRWANIKFWAAIVVGATLIAIK